jgi:hypothetical protein
MALLPRPIFKTILLNKVHSKSQRFKKNDSKNNLATSTLSSWVQQRIAKLTVVEKHIQYFLKVFDESVDLIRGFSGYQSMILLREKQTLIHFL